MSAGNSGTTTAATPPVDIKAESSKYFKACSYFNKRLFRIFGLVPLTIYVLVHLYNNNISHKGPEAFNEHLRSWHVLPFILPLTLIFLYIPLLWHMIYGLWVAKDAQPNNLRYGYFSNIRYILQRLSGVGLFLFIPAHIFKTKLEPFLHNETVDFNHMAEGLSEPLTLTVYALGILGVSYHVANGLWSAAVSWGLTINRSSQKFMVGIALVSFLLVAAMGGWAVWGFVKTTALAN